MHAHTAAIPVKKTIPSTQKMGIPGEGPLLLFIRFKQQNGTVGW